MLFQSSPTFASLSHCAISGQLMASYSASIRMVQLRLQNTQGPSTVLGVVPSNLCFTDTIKNIRNLGPYLVLILSAFNLLLGLLIDDTVLAPVENLSAFDFFDNVFIH